MLVRSLFFSFLLLAISSCVHLGESLDSTFQNSKKIASWNIRYAPEHLKEPTEDNKYPWEKRVKAMRHVFDQMTPVILATQEGNRRQLESLDDHLHQLTLYDSHRSWGSRFYPSFYVDLSAVKVEASGDLWLSNTPTVMDSKLAESQWPRMLTWLTFRLQAGGSKYLAVNVHMDADIPEQLNVLIKLLRDLRATVSHHSFLLLGDFNSPQGDQPWQELTSSLNLISLSSQETVEPTYNGHGETLPDRLNWHIDWVLGDKKTFGEEKVFYDLVKPRPYGPNFYVSDHELSVLRLPME